jgi:hypothetical protein
VLGLHRLDGRDHLAGSTASPSRTRIATTSTVPPKGE